MAMTVKSGRWSDPTVWDTGVVPGAGAMAHIKAPHQIIYDRESDVILADVMSEMGSKLTWDSAKETRLRVNTVILNGITEMVDHGLSATPGKPKHEIVFHPIAGKDPGAGTGLGGMFMAGSVTVRGEPGRAVRVVLPSSVSLRSAGGSTASIGRLTTDLPAGPRLGRDGTLRFSFGGRLTVTGELDGDYQGRIAVTVDYQ